MLSKISHRYAFLLAAVFALSCTLWAQSDEVDVVVAPATHTLTITIKGTIGPILSGSDPLGLDGQSGTVTILASESLSPTKKTFTSATYELPAGAVKVKAGSYQFSTKSPSKMVVDLTSKADILTLTAAGPDGLVATDTTSLKPNSWNTGILQHPTVFKPSPQKLTAAKSADGAGSKIKYTIDSLTTVLGFSGTASNKATEDPILP
jgi:hypothetical protein